MRPLDYVLGLSDTEYTSDCGQLIAVNCVNTTFKELDISSASIGLQLVASSNCTVSDCTGIEYKDNAFSNGLKEPVKIEE